MSSRRQKPAFAYQKQGWDKKLPERRKSGKRKIRTKEKDSASLKIILSVGAFDHDRNIVLAPLKRQTHNVRRTHIHDGNKTAYLQHRSDDYRIFSLEVVGHAHGQHLNCDDLAPMARRTVHAWIARNEEFGKLVHEFARRPARAEGDLGK